MNLLILKIKRGCFQTLKNKNESINKKTKKSEGHENFSICETSNKIYHLVNKT